MSNFRYFRFYPYSGSSPIYDGLLTVVNINLYDKSGTDVARNKSVTATSQYNATQSADKIVDGLSTTWWATGNGTGRTPNGSQYVTIDLGSEFEIERASFSTRAVANSYGVTETFKYAISLDGVEWNESELLTFNNLIYEENQMITIKPPVTNKILLLSNNKEKTIHYEENSVPDMVSATSPYGEVKASQQGGSPAWRAFSSTLNGINNGWRTSSGISNTRNQWISYTFPHPVKIDSYSMRGGGGGVGNSIMPKDFRFEGSNDEIVWHVLDEQAEVLASNDDTSWKTYKIHSSEKYKAYRIYSIVNNGQNNYTGISNIMFNGVDAYITDIPSQSEQSFINHGMTQSDLASIDMSAEFTEKHYNQDEFTPLGEGKVFEQALDVDKVIKKLVVK